MMILRLRELLQEASGLPAYPLTFPPTNLAQNDVRMTYQVITGSKRYTHQGDLRLTNETVQITLFSKNYGAATNALGDVDEFLSGYREKDGQIKMITIAGIAPDQKNQDSQVFQKSIDVNILYEE